MEDVVAVSSWNAPSGLVEYYAIFDGHGGHEISSFVQSVFHTILQEKMSSPGNAEKGLKTLLLDTFAEANDQAKKLLLKKNMLHKVVGSTGVVVLVHNGEVHCANVGDSRAILVSRDSANEDLIVAKSLSFDHKPNDKDEEARIKQAGGFISSSAFEGLLLPPLEVRRKENN